MNDEIEFGDVEHAQPRRCLPPDRDKRWVVAAVGQPAPEDLPIFVDLDVMCEMEAHAQSDRSIELGGVLLGGQYVDSSDRPYVVINECLRAEHYEATRGSFKFTHQTWERITRRRREFPDHVQMVGWYHTHPGWGVFLSGMDDFICEHFFNRPLDVALVIDPCQGDRGMFQWTAPPHRHTQRTGGFYVFASRFRESELEHFVFRLQEEPHMARESFSALPTSGDVNPWRDPRTSWMAVALLMMLSMQCILVALIAWRMAAPFTAASPPGPEAAQADSAVAQVGELQAQRQLLDQVVEGLGGGPQWATSMEEQRRELAAAKAALRGQDALRQRLEDQLLDVQLRAQRAGQQMERMQAELERQAASLKESLGQNQQLRAEIAELKGEAPGDTEQLAANDTRQWWWYGLSAVGVLGLAALAFALTRRRSVESVDAWETGQNDPSGAAASEDQSS